ncbi:MAG: hypothetical protein AVDCRST_MAG91-2878 [uncultured Sphingomonadaceae bacterium]|uniref:Lysozyme inhibitor LprI-like N-terminal domain-containing protein n=1 Tax=uncultured Sphingomonadaceae bacterium TaxID=169976 RepID=A0A6J4TSY2_9SPHN|nr:MAG: hypothetical protein AVDCRST_MAG91-2878 [uncultured Sphingomonadaceae bacterium]
MHVRAMAWKVAAAGGLLLTASACDLLGSSKKTEEKTEVAEKEEVSEEGKRLCASNATYARLKESAFDEAKRVRERDTERLDALADASIVRMERPVLESRDEALGLTVCSGRMVLELPPGAGRAFGGRQRLAADITYSAQAAADGSGTVYKIDGGEPIVYRLASFDPFRGETRTAAITPEGLDATDAEPEIVADTPEPEVSVPSPAPPVAMPQPRVTREPEVETPDPAIERARRRAQAERTVRAAAVAREEKARAAERRARDERVAEARRTERGEAVAERRPTRTARAEARSSARPSFPCRYARSRVEKMICGSDELAAQDRRMAAVYYRASDRSDPETRRRLSASRLRFLAYRDRCGNEACVANAYSDRIDEINDLASE